MADLSKYTEVYTVSSRIADAVERAVNEKLAAGWEIITSKIVEEQYPIHNGSKVEYIKKDGAFCFILGKPRAKAHVGDKEPNPINKAKHPARDREGV